MASLEQRIHLSSSQNQHLLQILTETDDAASSLEQNAAYLKNLREEALVRQQRVMNLTRAKDKEFKDHESEAIAEAEKKQRELQVVVKRHNTAQIELEVLYNFIFAGHTPECPEEDAKEWPVKTLKQAYDQVQLRVNTEAQVQSLLQSAEIQMANCLLQLQEACDASEMDILNIGGQYADIAERTSLSQAQLFSSQVQSLVFQAQRLQTLVQDIGPMNIAEGHVMSDIIFDNIFSDISFDERIWASRNQVAEAGRSLVGEGRVSRARLEELEAEAERVKGRFDRARGELVRARGEAFLRVDGGNPALPPYRE